MTVNTKSNTNARYAELFSVTAMEYEKKNIIER